MTVDAADAISKVLDVLIKLGWFVLVIVIIYKLFPTIREIVSKRSFTIKVSDMEISVQQASDQLSNQIGDLQKNVASLREHFKLPYASADELAPLRGISVLWVDDYPANNAYQIAQLHNDGAVIHEVHSTSEAIDYLNRERVNVIISDMGRKENDIFDPEAGIKLLQEVRKSDADTPIYFYSTSRVLKDRAAVIAAAGNSGATSSPVELVRLVHQKSA